MITSFEFASRSVVGTVRKNNEDSCHASADLAVVADGVGGRPAGEVASRICVETLKAAHARGVSLEDAIRIAHDVVRFGSEANSLLHTMLCTCTAATVVDGRVKVCHVGDSRAYLIAGGEIWQLTLDQTVGNKLVIHEGPDAIKKARNPAALYQVIGSHTDDLEVMQMEPDMEPGDLLLLCTDGLSGTVTEDLLMELATNEDLEQAADLLVDEALKESRDNVSLALLRVR